MEDAIGQYLCDFDTRAYNYRHQNSEGNSKVAVIVETRSAFFLPKVIKNFMALLGLSWNLHIFHGIQNEGFLKRKLPGWNVKYTRLEVNSLSVKNYNRLLKSIDFWQYIKEPHICIFQLDSVLFRSIPDEYLQFDFIGAPCGKNIMNGGFSLRQQKSMIRTIQEGKNRISDHPDEPEDIFFTEELRKHPKSVLPSTTQCQAFSAESIISPECIGGHGTTKYWLSGQQWRQMMLHLRI